MKRSVLSTFVAGLGVLGFAFAGVASGGCSKTAASAEAPPPEAPKQDNTVVTPAGAAAGPEATPGANLAATACTKNEDCHTQSFYCDSCQCLALGIGAKTPTCNGKPVQCFVDPCMKQKALCDHGKCVVATQT